MTAGLAPAVRERPPRGSSRPRWRVVLAAQGLATARPAARPATRPGDGVVVEEGHPGAVSRTEVHLAPDGLAIVRQVAAPPVLVLDAPWADVRPVAALHVPDVVRVGRGGLVFVCSPGLLGAMDPAEIIAAPRLLHAAGPSPAVLLDRWLWTAARRGVTGAAAAVARYDGPR